MNISKPILTFFQTPPRTPLLGVWFFYLLGILSSSSMEAHREIKVLWFLFGFFAWVSWSFKKRKTTNFFLFFFVFFLGMFRTEVQEVRYREIQKTLSHSSKDLFLVEGKVASYPLQKIDGYQYQVKLSLVQKGESWIPVRGILQVSHFGNFVPGLGDVIRFQTSIRIPRNFGNDQEFDFEKYALIRGIHWLGSISKGRSWVKIRGPSWFLTSWMNSLRRNILDRGEIFLSSTSLQLFSSMVLGDSGRVDSHLQEQFRSLGILHILVVSGFQISLASLFLGWTMGKLSSFFPSWFSKIPLGHFRILGAFFGGGLFFQFTSSSIPVFRAWGIACLGFFGYFFGRPRDALHLWMLCSFLFLAWNPWLCFDVSFQLSFAAVLGIIFSLEVFVSQPFSQKTFQEKILKSLKELMVITFGAFLFTLPTVLANFGQVSLWSWLNNMIFVPTLGSLPVILGIGACMFQGSFEPLGNFFLCCLEEVFHFTLPLVHWMCRWPGNPVWVSQPPVFFWIIYGWLLALFCLLVKQRLWKSWKWKIRWGVLCCLFWFSFFLSPDLILPGVHFLHVGQGDATLLVSERKKIILVDSGPGGPFHLNAVERIILPWLRIHGFSKIDLLVMTHGDLDHAGSMMNLFPEIQVEKLWIPKDHRSFLTQQIVQKAREYKIEIEEIHSQTPPVFWEGWEILPLHPSPFLKSQNSNDQSIVLQVRKGIHRFLLTGDIGFSVEKELLQKNKDLRSDVLKVSHHGSRSSTSTSFLQGVSPRFALIGSGYLNRYDHPSKEVLDRLQKEEIGIWRGDECGEIVIQLQGFQMKILSQKFCSVFY